MRLKLLVSLCAALGLAVIPAAAPAAAATAKWTVAYYIPPQRTGEIINHPERDVPLGRAFLEVLQGAWGDLCDLWHRAGPDLGRRHVLFRYAAGDLPLERHGLDGGRPRAGFGDHALPSVTAEAGPELL